MAGPVSSVIHVVSSRVRSGSGFTLVQHAVLWGAVAIAAATGYVVATVIVVITGMDGKANARILRCLGTSAGVALPTLCAVASSSVTAALAAGLVWSAGCGTVGWLPFARISLTPNSAVGA